TLLSYWRFPESFSSVGTQGVNSLVPSLPEARGGIAGPAYFLYLLVPLLSALLGGRHAALRGGAVSRTEAMWLGAAAGAGFAVLVAVTAGVSGLGFNASASVGLDVTLSGSIGPAVAAGGLVALLWGVVGGAAGGVIQARALPPQPPPPGPPEQAAG
ncbi:MAG: hypothetical protein HYU54_04055, partial [Actinobacteria bacterium]|nr:hypothetical protein [Actinomycetota bacterium]